MPGPGHSSADRSLKIADRDGGGVLVHSFAGDNWRRCKDYLRELGLHDGLGFMRPPTPALVIRPNPNGQHELGLDWRDFWRGCRPIEAESIAGRYLLGRNCRLPPFDGDLRWRSRVKHWRAHRSSPALVALVTDPKSATPRSLHFTFLNADGTGKAPVEPQRLFLPGHSIKGGVCRLWPDEAVETALGVAEGLETALTLARGFAPVWATLSASSMGDLPVLGGIEALTMAVDRDRAGERAASAVAQRWIAAGREVRQL